MNSPEVPPHIKLEQEKAAWDVEQRKKEQGKEQSRVIVTGIDIPFTKLVGFLVNLAIAAVPAGIIVAILWMILAAVLFGGK